MLTIQRKPLSLLAVRRTAQRRFVVTVVN